MDEVDRKLVIDTFIGTPAGELQRGNIVRLWQRRRCVTFTIVVNPSITTISWLQSN